jgi:hypothetical protein
VQLVEQIHQIVPAVADVIFVGNGEFDGITLQSTIDGYGWEYITSTDISYSNVNPFSVKSFKQASTTSGS